MNNHLLLIDPQNDFCDVPPDYRPTSAEQGTAIGPALPVAGAHADMQRVAALIDRVGAAFQRITVTLDSHQHFDIGHPTFWRQADGGAVSPFTQVSVDDVRAGRFRPRRAELEQRVIAYLEALQAAGRYRHMVWPVHCELGSWGHNVHADVLRAYNRWEEANVTSVEKVLKGQNPYTEHYSAIQAEVPDPEDLETGSNAALLAALASADRIYIAGEASSHCVKATTEHIVQHFSPSQRQRLVLLTDCMSPVGGFEGLQSEFFDAMQKLGVALLTSEQAVARLSTELRAGGAG